MPEKLLQSDRPHKIPNRISTAAIICALLAFLSAIIVTSTVRFNDATVGLHRGIQLIAAWAFLVSIISAIFGFVLALLSLIVIFFKRGKYSGVRNAVIAIFLIILMTGFMMPALDRVRPPTLRLMCQAHIEDLGKALALYSQRYDGLIPDKVNWCDALIKSDCSGGYYNACPATTVSRNFSSYALNQRFSNIKLVDVPKNAVLLFETANPNKNPYGDSKSITGANHKGIGCNVLFGDLHAEFVRVEDFNSLHW